MSAWTETVPSGDRRSTLWSRIDTTSSEPSGSQPRPEGCASTVITSSVAPSGAMANTVCR
jgi:hypothetical protein